MKRTEMELAPEQHQALLPKGCAADQVLRLLWHEWTTHIIWVLGEADALAFGELHRRVDGISRKVLTERLRRMTASGLIDRRPQPGASRAVLYALTNMGRDVDQALRALEPVIARWK
jgi:DNA-binding HxlR family transcriptional regulator